MFESVAEKERKKLTSRTTRARTVRFIGGPPLSLEGHAPSTLFPETGSPGTGSLETGSQETSGQRRESALLYLPMRVVRRRGEVNDVEADPPDP